MAWIISSQEERRLGAGNFYLLVKNPTEFRKKYPNARIDGVFTNNLANGGEALAIIHAAGAPIQQFTFDDQAPWPTLADGAGFSLVPKVNDINVNYSLAASWRASSQAGGSPGAEDPPQNIAPIVINEILTHTDLPTVDAIELHNPTAAAVNVSGWFLTDDQGTPKKYRIPSDTAPILPGGYLVVTETQFNNPAAPATSFALSSHGDEVYLFSAALDGALTGYSQGFSFRAAANGVSFGRYTNSVGEILYPSQSSLTLGAVNSGPHVGPVVINEINYNPSASGDEFIELKNITSSPVSLFDPNFPTNTWRLAGVDFNFPTNTVIPPNGLIVISGIEPATFRQHANLPSSIAVLGPFTGNLQSNGELIELLRPDGVDNETNNGVVTKIVPLVVVDSVRYSDQSPWPTNASGTGNSIERKTAGAFGNDPQNWRASPGTTSPGLDNDGNRLPVVDAGANIAFVSSTFPVSTNIIGSAADDGLPNPPAALTYAWTQSSGPGVVQIQNANQPNATFSFPGVGVFTLRLTVSDGEYSAVDDVTVSISRPTAAQVLIPAGATWKYIDNGLAQLANWKLVNFTETGWKQGAAPSRLHLSRHCHSRQLGPQQRGQIRHHLFPSFLQPGQPPDCNCARITTPPR